MGFASASCFSSGLTTFSTGRQSVTRRSIVLSSSNLLMPEEAVRPAAAPSRGSLGSLLVGPKTSNPLFWASGWSKLKEDAKGSAGSVGLRGCPLGGNPELGSV